MQEVLSYLVIDAKEWISKRNKMPPTGVLKVELFDV